MSIAQYQTGPDAQEDFPGIAYHFVIDASGKPAYTQDIGRRVWHNGAPGRNERAIGICYTGNLQATDAQIKGIQQAIDWCRSTLARSLSISGHKDTYATACPGPTWNQWRSQLR